MSKDDQINRFKQAAHDLGADGDPQEFDRVLEKIAEAAPPESVQERKKPKKKTDKADE